MDHRVVGLAIALPVASAFALPAKASESPAPVKVALTDMSSAMGMGSAGRGMMSHGMISPGQGVMYFGLLPPGQGQSGILPGSGMMMGMMAVRINQPSVKAGAVRFDVTNWSRVCCIKCLSSPSIIRKRRSHMTMGRREWQSIR